MTIMEHVNGTVRQGRTVPPLPEHTFKDSGITIKIRKVGPTTHRQLGIQIRKEIPEPEPPRNAPDSEAAALGEEFNRADPAFEQAMEEWNKKTNTELSTRLLLVAALEAEVTIDNAGRADIARKKRSMELANIPWVPDPRWTPEEEDRVFYILHVAASTPEELGEFGAAVLRRSVPTEEAVQAQIATFQRDVPE